MNKDRIAELITELLKEIGEDPNREGLLKTPERVANSWETLVGGYGKDPEALVKDATFEAHSTDMVILRDIEIYSLCEHHMLPFYGKCHIGYIPDGRLMGVSKMARIVECFARRLQIQERLTTQVARAIMDNMGCKGVGVVMECRHLCMMMRGVEKQNSVMTTSSVLGSFRESTATREEFMSLALRRSD